MITAGDIFDYLCELAPLDLQMSFDNSGFLVGRKASKVERALLSLDVTEDVVNEAIDMGAELIISHHPIIFGAIKSVCDEKLLRLAENHIAVISMHTNLDIAEGGVNDELIRLLGGECCGTLDEDNCGRIGYLNEPMDLKDFLSLCKDKLDTKGLRYADGGRKVYKLAVMGGAGGESIECAFEKGCDTYVTADIKYHQFLQAKALGINLIDGDHFCTENPVIPMLRDKLKDKFPDVEFNISERHHQIISFF